MLFLLLLADQRLVSITPLRGSRISLDQVNLLVIWGSWGREASVTLRSSWVIAVTSFW